MAALRLHHLTAVQHATNRRHSSDPEHADPVPKRASQNTAAGVSPNAGTEAFAIVRRGYWIRPSRGTRAPVWIKKPAASTAAEGLNNKTNVPERPDPRNGT